MRKVICAVALGLVGCTKGFPSSGEIDDFFSKRSDVALGRTSSEVSRFVARLAKADNPSAVVIQNEVGSRLVAEYSKTGDESIVTGIDLVRWNRVDAATMFYVCGYYRALIISSPKYVEHARGSSSAACALWRCASDLGETSIEPIVGSGTRSSCK